MDPMEIKKHKVSKIILAVDPPIREQTAADPKLTSLEMGAFRPVGYSSAFTYS
jgi:hypothetical protein